MARLPASAQAARSGIWARMAAAFAAGALFVAALPPLSLSVLAPISFAVLFLLLQGEGRRRAAAIGWAFGVGQFAFGLSWIGESFQVEAETFGALALPAVGALAAGLALFPALSALVFAALARARPFAASPVAAVLFAASWTGGEWLRGHVLTGFPWNLAAYALSAAPALRQPAAWFGSYGLGFLLVLAGAWLGSAALMRGRARLLALMLAPGLVAVGWGAGGMRLAAPLPDPPGTRLRIVQGNIPQKEKWAPGARERMLEKYLRLSSRPGDFDLLLWPETAFPGFLDEDTQARARIAAALPEGALLMTGAPDRARGRDGATRYFNSVEVYDWRGELLTGYAKHHLVPFGEYVPLRGWLPLPRIVQSLGDFSPGPGPRTLALPGVPLVAPTICYEIIFPAQVADRQMRPDWIFNATNDAWFGRSIGPEQHLAAARMRAVEEGLPVIRAANTGISAVIDARGRVLARRALLADGVIDAPLPPALPPTPYARLGDLAMLALIGLTLLLAVLLGGLARAAGLAREGRQ